MARRIIDRLASVVRAVLVATTYWSIVVSVVLGELRYSLALTPVVSAVDVGQYRVHKGLVRSVSLHGRDLGLAHLVHIFLYQDCALYTRVAGERKLPQWIRPKDYLAALHPSATERVSGDKRGK